MLEFAPGEEKVLQIRRDTVEAVAGGNFTLIDPGGMNWVGRCRSVDYGPREHYAVNGTVTSGPHEWVGLEVTISGQYDGETLSLRPVHAKEKQERDLFSLAY